MGLEPMSLTSVALMAKYLNVRQRKWGTIIIQTVHILHSADTGSMPMEDFFKDIPNYFQITQPGSSTVTPPYQWRRLKYQWRRLRTNGRSMVLSILYCGSHGPALPDTAGAGRRAGESLRVQSGSYSAKGWGPWTWNGTGMLQFQLLLDVASTINQLFLIFSVFATRWFSLLSAQSLV